MLCRVPLALPLVVAILSGCGGGSDDHSGPPDVACSPATSTTLVVNAPPTCGSLADVEYTRYWFTANAIGTYSVTLWTKSGDVDLYVIADSGSYHSENSPPGWVDAVTFPVTWVPSGPQVTVNAPGAASTYAIQVTGP